MSNIKGFKRTYKEIKSNGDKDYDSKVVRKQERSIAKQKIRTELEQNYKADHRLHIN